MRANVLRDGSDRPAGSTTTGEIEPSLMLPETLHHSGRLWTAEELVKRCLTNLPGRPLLARFPNGIKPPINIEWDSMPAAEALATILRGSGLAMAYMISGKVAIYRAGGGFADIEELRKRNPSVLALGATPAYRPGSAVVVGGPTVRTATSRWLVPVIEDDEGVFRFFAAVLDGWGYPVLDALRDLTAQPSDAFKSVPGGTDAVRKDRTRRLKRDLLRAYQAGNSFLWPWRDRAELNQTGAALPPLVLAARYGIAPLFQAGLDADYTAAIARTEGASAAFHRHSHGQTQLTRSAWMPHGVRSLRPGDHGSRRGRPPWIETQGAICSRIRWRQSHHRNRRTFGALELRQEMASTLLVSRATRISCHVRRRSLLAANACAIYARA